MKIIFGSAQLMSDYGINKDGKNLKIPKLKEIFKFLKNKKTFYIDTAEAYGPAEKIIGKLVNSKFKVITKISSLKKYNIDKLDDVIFHKVNQSLKNLQTHKIYAVLIHDENDLKGKKGKKIVSVLKRIKKQGLVKKIGFSCYNKNVLLKNIKQNNFDIVQFPMNVFDQRLLDKKIGNLIKKKRIEVHIRSIFLQGLLTLRNKKINLLNKNLKKKMILWNKFLKQNRLLPVEACIEFIKKNNKNYKIVVGINNIKQLKEIYNFLNSKKRHNLNFNRLIVNNEKIINPSKWQ